MGTSLQDSIWKLLAQRPIPVEEIISNLGSAACIHNESDLSIVNKIAELDDVMDEILAYPAMALLPAWGSPGIEILSRMVTNGPHYTTALSILTVIALGRIPTARDLYFLPKNWGTLCEYKVDEKQSREALLSLRSVILEHLTDPYKKSRLLSAISHQAMFGSGDRGEEERLDFLLAMLIDSQTVLNQTILEGFEDLLARGPAREEEMHKFLVKHPVLLDAFVMELRSKHELGDDFITDFVIRRSNDEYVLVEIENSTDRLFKREGTFSVNLNTAIAQVRDFQAWVSENIAYARTKLPGIMHPDGLVVIGRRNELTSEMQKRLAEENFSRRGHIRIITFDDLLSQARVVYRNMLERPLVLQSRDQKSL